MLSPETARPEIIPSPEWEEGWGWGGGGEHLVVNREIVHLARAGSLSLFLSLSLSHESIKYGAREWEGAT